MNIESTGKIGFQLKSVKRKQPITDITNPKFNDNVDDNDDEHKPKKNIVIPLVEKIISSNNNSSKNNKNTESTPSKSLDELAALEVINDFKNNDKSNKAFSSTLVIDSINDTHTNGDKTKSAPLLMASIAPELQGITNDSEKFKIDISLRAEDMNFKSTIYKEIPVEEYGAAMLRGMGWSGPNEDDNKYSTQLNQFTLKLVELPIKKGMHMGLGASLNPLVSQKKTNNVTILQSQDKIKNEWLQKAEQKLSQQELQIGTIVWLRDVKYSGNRGIIQQVKGVPGLNKIKVLLEHTHEEVIVKKVDVVKLSAEELNEKPFHYPPHYTITNSNNNTLSSEMTLNDQNSSDFSIIENKNPDTVTMKIQTSLVQLSNESSNSIMTDHNSIDDKGQMESSLLSIQKAHTDDMRVNNKSSDATTTTHGTITTTTTTTMNKTNVMSYNNDTPQEYSKKNNILEKYGTLSHSESTSKSKYSISKNEYTFSKSTITTTSTPSTSSSSSSWWLMTGLKVKYIDSSHKYYLKKGVILDVYPHPEKPHIQVCSLRLHTSQNTVILDKVKQKYIETIIPHSGETCVILQHRKYRHQRGKVLERYNDKNEVMIQLIEEMNIVLNLSMDDICAYDETLLFS